MFWTDLSKREVKTFFKKYVDMNSFKNAYNSVACEPVLWLRWLNTYKEI